jgi:hypothetical protein
MLIKAPPTIQGARDKLVWDLLEYFKKYEHIPEDKRWKHVEEKDLTLISNEIMKCQQDYRYAAQNYFWISDKQGNDKLLRLWDGQELLLQKMEEMKKRGKAQRVILIKARQLGMSLFGNSIVFWTCVFKPNRKGLIVSEDIDQSTNLFNTYLSPMYRQLPWWLRPRYSSFSITDGIVFDVPMKEGGIGLNSAVRVQWSTKKGGMGQGYKLNAFHGSEFTAWGNLKESLEEDLKYALVNHPDTIAILESTAKGAGTPSHHFYTKCEELAERSDWEPVFLPYFFETTRVMAPPNGWRLGEEENRMRDVVYENWVQCSDKKCKRFFNRKISKGKRDGQKCPNCGSGELKPYTLTDEQIYFIVNEKLNASDPRSIKQELALTAEEAFISSGDPVFSEKSIENATYTCAKAQKPRKGFFDKHGFFHGYDSDDLSRKCHLQGCTAFHEGDEHYLSVWEDPLPGAQYQIGVDVGYGKGKDDSVAWVNRVGVRGAPDFHVATLCTNITDPLTLSYELAKLGKWYNDAQIAVEYNSPGNSTADQLLVNLTYPNVYKKRPGSISVAQGAYHWQTTQVTKPKLIVSLDRWLKEGIFHVQDKRLVEQMKTFTKEDDSVKTGAQRGFKDDILIAAAICLYTAHQGDYEDNYGIIPQKVEKDPSLCLYKMSCDRCKKDWGADDPSAINRCPFCESRLLKAQRNMQAQSPVQNPRSDIRNMEIEPDGYLSSYESNDPYMPDYSML